MGGFQGIGALIRDHGFFCSTCGKFHPVSLGKLILQRGALRELPGELAALGVKKTYVFTDANLSGTVGAKVCEILAKAGVPYVFYALQEKRPMPDEHTLGEAAMHCPAACDGIVAIGGGVINDTAKMLTNLSGKPFLYVATAPSMDGFASTSASMDVQGMKTTLPAIPASTVLADTDILAAAPKEMILSGIGDMAAKIISLAEWKMAPYVTGEFYCPEIAEMMQSSVDKVLAAAPAAVRRDPEAVAAVTEGLILAGMAMTAAGMSRPASGMEHYISHIRDMRALEFGTRNDLHGLQCGLAVLYCLRGYEKLRALTPDREKALAHAAAFRYETLAARLREFIGRGAEAMIALEAKEGKYNAEKHRERFEKILSHWDTLTAVMGELPSSAEYEVFCKTVGFPTRPEDLGMTEAEMQNLVSVACNVRDKYVMSRFFWDLGEELF